MDLIEDLVARPVLWSASQEYIIKQPYDHLALQPGKNFRNKLIQIFNKFYKLSSEQVSIISQLVGILHVSSLLIDDIEDNSIWRRGKPSAHVVFGLPMVINTANYMYFVSMSLLQKLAENQKPEVLSQLLLIFNEEMMNLHRGQGLDIYWRDNFIVPSELDYYKMVMNKTGGLFRLTIRIMECLQGKVEYSLVPLTNILGVLYQVRDDYLNLKDSKMISLKGFADDITEGKFSFPIIHGLQHARENDPKGFELLSRTLKRQHNNDEEKVMVVEYLSNVSCSLHYTKVKIYQICELIKRKYIPREDKDLHAFVDKLSSL
ncbi:farnesyltranstransferase Ecym_1170 [Eremothecium cymbalariae DBVPG|uniref:Geranylgeranyl pyrophosphate synthase n=1 Tax=Eremothecium cymbalariae (strain CBS 270.75 / DBVPG 7215 / KCTC 17166 / NRRL Y-17582) TaxID=931890 RepID=G8JMV6_ERECY|nr:hypothetical protein Ecym_1170 [Eremothecium cymbalariae DBVPG\